MTQIPTSQFELRPTTSLHANPLNPRGPVSEDDVAELVASVREHGVLQPLLVTPEGIVVAGHRRLAAARIAGLADVPVTLRALDEQAQLELMLVENVQREDLTPMQEAHAYEALRTRGLGHGDIARRIGVTQARVQTRLTLLRCSPAVQELFDRLELPLTAAVPLARIDDWTRQKKLAGLVARRALTVSQLEDMIKRGEDLANTPPIPTSPTEAPSRNLPPSKQGPERAAALKLLASTQERTISHARLVMMADALCCACGTEATRPELCRTCPLPKFLTLIAQNPERSTTVSMAAMGARRAS